MKVFLKNIILFSIPILLGIGILFFIPVDKNFSYHFVKGECDNKASWIYHRVFASTDSIDIAFIGASQTGCAIMDELIEKGINKRPGKINVANLGYCRRGRDIQFIFLKDLFEHKHPKIVVVEVPEDEPKKSHPVFPYLAGTRDLFGSFVLFNQRFLTAIWKGITVRFEFLKFRIFKTTSAGVENNAPFGYIPSAHKAATKTLIQNEISWKKRLTKHISPFMRKIEANYSKHYLKKMVSLANENNCTTIFLYLPESGSHLSTPILSGFYQNMAPLWFLPDSVIAKQTNWKDAMHFNDSGAEQTSLFLVHRLTEVLETKK